MNSLVQYESSSEESDEASNETAPEPELAKGLFKHLPQPKKNEIWNSNVDKQEDKLIYKREATIRSKVRKPVKIGVPSLEEFQVDEDEPKAKIAKTLKGSGLFGILPPPKTTPLTPKSFIPHVLSVKKDTAITKKRVEKPKRSIPPESDDEFSELPDTFDDETWLKICGRKKKKPPTIPPPVQNLEKPQIESAPEPAEKQNADMLNNEAFKELIGSSKRPVNVKLIDINEEEILPDKDVWMTKALTDPECEPKYEEKEPVNNTCKKKHHITYLVQQAKANEQDLKNQWAANRYSRKQTQAKYGF